MKKIGRYNIQGLLGKGGMGKVYKVDLPPIGKIGALKLLDPDPLLTQVMGYEHLHRLFIQEAVTLAAIRHPNVIQIHDFDMVHGRPFYVMDFFANNLGTLMGESYQLERPGRVLSIDKAIDYADQTLSGLCGLHDAGILHRDIKPFNLLLSDRDTVKICDFGLSKLRGETFAGPANLKVGSPYYAAPEQEENPDSADVRSDLYPVGVMLYRMLTGRLPDTVIQHNGCAPPSRLNPDLDEYWDAFMVQAIARRPEQRFPDAAAMRSALTELELHWQGQKEKRCSIAWPRDENQRSEVLSAHRPPRQTPVKCRPSEAARRFHLDPLWRPKHYSVNRFTHPEDSCIADQSSGLAWQQSGSAYPRTWRQAHAYIDRLNEQQFAGHTNWRLPTIDELITLLKPQPHGQDLCIAPVFDATQRWIWSTDRRSFLAAYYVDMELGFVGWQDFSAPFYVRAVRTVHPK
jgi:serine/threonine protein kinase